MSDLDDFELEKTETAAQPEEEAPPPLLPASPEPELPSLGLVAAGLACVGVVALVGFLALRPARKAATATPSPAVRAAAPSPTTAPLPSPSPLPPLPALDESDAVARAEGAALGRHRLVELWLSGRDLVRVAASSINAVAEGFVPRQQLALLAPTGAFAVKERRGEITLDAASYARYDELAAAVDSVDAATCAALFTRFEPLLDKAYQELGSPEGRLRPVLAKAIARLVDTQPVEGDVALRRVVRAKVLYEYADPALEALSPAQKQLLRMGPQNARRVQARLRDLRAALGGESVPSR